MKHNLTPNLMTSFQRGFPGFLLSALLTSYISNPVAAFANDNASIRDHIIRGNALLARRQFQDAISEYEAVLQLQPDYPVAKSNIALTHNNWGIFLYSQRKYAEAKEHWETSLKLNPRDGNVVRNLKIAENALARNPQSPQQNSNPKPTGPQDWNPFDESLDKIPKKPVSSASSDSPPNMVATPSHTPHSNSASSGASFAGSSGSGSGSSVGASGSSAGGNASAPSSPIVILGGTSGSSSSVGSVSEGSQKSTQTSARSSVSVTAEDPFSSPSSEPTPPSGTPNFNTVESTPTSVRIVGGTSGGASIVGGSTVSGSGKSFTPNTTSSTAPPTFVPAKLPSKPAGGSVPMSWPGADEERAPMTGRSTKSPSFLKNNEDAPEVQNDSNNVEGLLEQIETKVYGKATKNQPILKRIEKLEVDTLGRKKSGPVADRLKELKETYGL